MISLRSGVTKQLLNYLLLNPKEELYVNELSRKLDLDKRNLVKKLKDLEKEGILTSQERGNLRLYSIDTTYPLYKEYRAIFLKTIGLEARLKDIIRKVAGVTKAYIYGSYASGTMDTHSDIDLLVIGSHSILKLQKEISRLQKEIGREINVLNMDDNAFEKKRKNKDVFISRVLAQKHIMLTK